jgi:hypothetical protein
VQLAEYMTPPSIHFLIEHTHAILKSGLTPAAVGGGPGRPAASSTAQRGAGGGGVGHDLAAMELRRLSPPALLEQLAPTLHTLRAHCDTLAQLIPAALGEREVLDHLTAFNLDTEDSSLQERFVDPALLLAMQTLTLALESSQLRDDASQTTLLTLLRTFGSPTAAAELPDASQAPDADADDAQPSAACSVRRAHRTTSSNGPERRTASHEGSTMPRSACGRTARSLTTRLRLLYVAGMRRRPSTTLMPSSRRCRRSRCSRRCSPSAVRSSR